MFKNILIGILVLTTVYFAWIALTIETNPLQRAYKQYNHVRIYEDGSFEGEDRQGNKESGCIPQALCND